MSRYTGCQYGQSVYNKNYLHFKHVCRGEKCQNLARHIALVHNKLDELLADEELVEARRQEHLVSPHQRMANYIGAAVYVE